MTVTSFVLVTVLSQLLRVIWCQYLFSPLFVGLFSSLSSSNKKEKSPALSDAQVAILEKIYVENAAKFDDPNEIKKISTTTSLSIQVINTWFRSRRSTERNAGKGIRFAESTWKLLLYSLSAYGSYAYVNLEWKDFDSTDVYLFAQAIGFTHFLLWAVDYQLIAPMKSGNSGVVVVWMDFFIVIGEYFARLGLILVSYYCFWGLQQQYNNKAIFIPLLAFVANVSLYHDVCEIALEVSKILSLLSQHVLSLYVFTLFFVSHWAWYRLYKFPMLMYWLYTSHQYKEQATEYFYVLCLLFGGVLFVYDLFGFGIILKSSRIALWSGLDKKNTKLEEAGRLSISASDFDSDSSISSTIREHEE